MAWSLSVMWVKMTGASDRELMTMPRQAIHLVRHRLVVMVGTNTGVDNDAKDRPVDCQLCSPTPEMANAMCWQVVGVIVVGMTTLRCKKSTVYLNPNIPAKPKNEVFVSF